MALYANRVTQTGGVLDDGGVLAPRPVRSHGGLLVEEGPHPIGVMMPKVIDAKNRSVARFMPLTPRSGGPSYSYLEDPVPVGLMSVTPGGIFLRVMAR